jgi:hypothetical protein
MKGTLCCVHVLQYIVLLISGGFITFVALLHVAGKVTAISSAFLHCCVFLCGLGCSQGLALRSSWHDVRQLLCLMESTTRD